MMPLELVPYHKSLTAMRGELYTLVTKLASIRACAARVADAAARAARAMPSDADCGPDIVAGLNEISAGMTGLANDFAALRDAIAGQAADCARRISAFELALKRRTKG